MANSKFNPEVFKRFNRRRGGKIYGKGLPGKTDPNSDNRMKFSKRSDIPRPTEASSPIKYGPNRPMPKVHKQKDQESNHPHHHHKRRHRDDFPRSTKHHPDHPNHPDHPDHPNHHPDNNNHPNHPHHKTVENNKPQPHQHTHPNKTPNPLPPRTTPRPIPTPTPNPGPLPPHKSKYNLTNLPDKTNLRDKPPIKYPQPTPTPTPTPTQTYPAGSKYGPNRPMPNIKNAVARGSKYDFTTKSGDKTFNSDTLLRKLNRRRNGS